MRVIVECSCFEAHDAQASLMQLFLFGLQGRHRVLLEDAADVRVGVWLDTKDPATRELVTQSLDHSSLEEAINPSGREIRVGVDASQWEANPPVLNHLDAIAFLGIAFQLVLEDGESDRAFLLAFCDEHQRAWFLRKESAAHIVFANGGGLGSMQRLADGVAVDVRRRLLHWLLFDSDALQPAAPSTQSSSLRATCEGAAIPYCQLIRRFAESYIPIRSLHGWIGANRRQREHLPRVGALAALSDPQRHHYNMKRGFARDRQRYDNGETAGTLYMHVPADVMTELENGFGSQVSELFSNGFVHEAELRRDTGWDEMQAAVDAVMTLVR